MYGGEELLSPVARGATVEDNSRPETRELSSSISLSTKLLASFIETGANKPKTKSISKSLPNFTWQILCFAGF
jgi:hypothetical protein